MYRGKGVHSQYANIHYNKLYINGERWELDQLERDMWEMEGHWELTKIKEGNIAKDQRRKQKGKQRRKNPTKCNF